MADSSSTENFRDLVERLHHPQTRRAARQELLRARAVEPLLDCLQSPNESVVWAAVASLGELRASEAVEALLSLLERGVLVVDVTEALNSITGQDFGGNVSQWRRWLRKSGGQSVGLDLGQCVAQTAEYLGVEPSRKNNSFRFKLALPEGRFQKVAVYFGREDPQGDELVMIYSECGPVNPKYFEAILRKNLSIPAGAFAIRDVDGEPNFVLVDTLLARSVTPSILAKKIENIAARADLVEKSLTKEDKR